MNLKGVREIKDKEYFDAQQKELQEILDHERITEDANFKAIQEHCLDHIESEEVNEYEQLKDNLYDLWSQLESNKIELELAVEAVGSIHRYYKAKEIIK